MTAKKREKGERRRRVWKTAGLALLGLMGGVSGCQWTGDHSTRGASADPPAAVASPERYRPHYARTTVETNSPHSNATEPANVTTEIQQVSAKVPMEAAAPSESAAAPESAASPDARRESAGQGELVLASASAAANAPNNLPQATAEKAAARERAAAEDKGYQVDRSLPSPAQGIATPVIPEPQKAFPITLGASLALAGVANPVIGMANQAIVTARAEQMQARLLLVPNINVGSSFNTHTGPVQASFGGIRKISRNSVLYGLGVNTVAAETVKIPGLFIFQPITEVIFAPLVARQIVTNRRYLATATRNQVLLEVATGYVGLLGAEGRLAVIRQSEKDFDETVRLTANYLKTGAGNKADADRAQADSLALRYQEQEAQEEVAVASAELAKLLNLDPSTRLNTAEVPIQIVQFIDPKLSLDALLEIATRNRPELAAAATAIRIAQTRLREEKARPLLPTLWAGFSADDFGGGTVASTNGNVPNPHNDPPPSGSASAATGGRTVPTFGRITGRTDVDVFAFWTLQNAGFGNYAHIKERRAQLNVAQSERVHILNEVAREVAEAYNTSAAQFQSIEIERRRVQEATDGFQRDLDLIRAGGAERGGARPIEVLNQAKRLAASRQRLLAALIAYDRAQFQLFVALGQPPTLALDEANAPPPVPVGATPTP